MAKKPHRVRAEITMRSKHKFRLHFLRKFLSCSQLFLLEGRPGNQCQNRPVAHALWGIWLCILYYTNLKKHESSANDAATAADFFRVAAEERRPIRAASFYFMSFA